MTRITRDRLRGSMSKTRSTLVQGVTWDEANSCGCPLGIMARAEDCPVNRLDLCDRIDVTEDYAKGIVDGFDGLPSHAFLGQFEAYRLGHADGMAIAASDLMKLSWAEPVSAR